MRVVGTKLSPLALTRLVAALPLFFVSACSGEDPGSQSNGAGTGGASTATAGSPALAGGSTATGGANTTGGMGVGGSSGSGIAGSTGGAGASGQGGMPSTGGTSAGGSSGSGGGGAGAATTTDAKGLLKTFRPADATLAGKLDGYVDNEIGTPVIAETGTGMARTITQTMVVPPGVTYDGKGEKLTAKGMGNGSQDEGQLPLFILTPGASLKNVTITAPGVEGVHMMGDNTLENIVWEDVGEDAASVRSYFPGGKISITGGSARSAEDKCFQFNAPSDVTIKNFKASSVGKLVRQGGSTPITITLDTVTVTGVREAVVMCNTSACTVRYHAVETNGTLFKGPVKSEKF